MAMTMRERILAVYRGETPDVVPYMLDLSHWFYHKNCIPWDLSVAYDKPEYELIAYHKQAGAGFYMPNLGSVYSVAYGDDVQAEVVKVVHDGVPEIVWRLTTPLGSIERRRMWEESSYSWAITRWGVQTEQDLRVLGYALASRTYAPLWDRYRAWVDEVGDMGVVYLSAGYSAMGHILNYWLGVSGTAYAAADWPDDPTRGCRSDQRQYPEVDRPARLLACRDHHYGRQLFERPPAAPFLCEMVAFLLCRGDPPTARGRQMRGGPYRRQIARGHRHDPRCGRRLRRCDHPGAHGRLEPARMSRGGGTRFHPLRRRAAHPVAARCARARHSRSPCSTGWR